MFWHLVKLTIRNLVRNKLFTLINILGLAIGMAICFLILLWVYDEMIFDTQFENGDRIYRILADVEGNEGQQTVAVLPAALVHVVRERLPEVELATRFRTWRQWRLRTGGEKAYVTALSNYADTSFVKVFDIPFLHGNPDTALDDPHKIVISDQLSIQLFGTENSLGRTIENKKGDIYTVSGVIEQLHHTHFPFDFIVSFDHFRDEGYPIDSLENAVANFWVYILVRDGVDIDLLQKKMKTLLEEMTPDRRDAMQLSIQPLLEVYLHSSFAYDFTRRGDFTYVLIFSTVAVMVLLIACVNFMNLTTARSFNRALEIGIRKTFGAHRSQLIRQFYGETFLICLVALIVAVLITVLLLPLFNELSGKQITLDLHNQWILIAGMIGITFFTGLISGSYPALFISSFHPLRAIRHRKSTSRPSVIFRSGLVVFQILISVVLMILSIDVHRQLDYIRNKELGYNPRDLYWIPIEPEMISKKEEIRQEISGLPGVQQVALTTVLPIYEAPSGPVQEWDGKNDDSQFRVHGYSVSPEYVDAMQIQVLEGKTPQKMYTPDSLLAVMVNQAFVRRVGWDEPVGREFVLWGAYKARVVAVLQDFHFDTVRNRIQPLSLDISSTSTHMLLIRVGADAAATTLEEIEKTLHRFDPDNEAKPRSLQQTLDRLYLPEHRMGQLTTYFSVLAILISCLGLFGLATFITIKRLKEIGIRKVLGGSVMGLVRMQMLQYLRWVLIGNLIGWPLAWYLSGLWMENFTYHVQPVWWNYTLVLLLTLVFSLGTSMIQILRATRRNPADILRYE